MFADTRPAALDADGGVDPWREFRVDHPREILALLGRLRDGNHTVNLNAPDGQLLATTLWSIDERQRCLNFGVEPEQPELAALIEADEIVAVAYLDSIKLQFDLDGLTLVRGARSAALQAAWPDRMYRFQRRSAFRVRTHESTRPTAHLRHPALPDMALALRVLDVSIGGCALFLPHDVPPLQPGTHLGSVHFALDGETRFDTGLQLQHVTAIQSHARGVRLGCAWRTLGVATERVLQRYIDRTQKQRRLLSLG